MVESIGRLRGCLQGIQFQIREVLVQRAEEPHIEAARIFRIITWRQDMIRGYVVEVESVPVQDQFDAATLAPQIPVRDRERPRHGCALDGPLDSRLPGDDPELPFSCMCCEGACRRHRQKQPDRCSQYSHARRSSHIRVHCLADANGARDRSTGQPFLQGHDPIGHVPDGESR